MIEPNSRAIHNPVAWDLLRRFATDDAMGLPTAEELMKKALGDQYKDSEWKEAYDAVLAAENDAAAALDAIEKLAAKASKNLVIRIPARAQPSQTEAIETDLKKVIDDLKERRRIHGEVPTIEELIEPIEEVVQDPKFTFESDDEIIKQVEEEMNPGEVEDCDDEDHDEPKGVSVTEMVQLCERLQQACIAYGVDEGLTVARQLCKFRGQLRREEHSKLKQAPIDKFFSRPV